MITALDLGIIGAYIVAMLVIGILLIRTKNIDDYLVNRRQTKLIFLIFTIVSTNVGAGFFISIASESYSTGISFGLALTIVSIISLVVLAYFGPRIKQFGDQNKAYTLPQFFGVVYNSIPNRILVALTILIGYVFLTALQFVAIGAAASVITGFDLNTVILLVGIVTIVYTAISGFKGDIFVDMISFLITAGILAYIIPTVILNTGLPPLPLEYYDPFAFGGPPFIVFAIIFGGIVALLQMELWQRLYSAESPKIVRKAVLISAGVQVPFIISAIILGLLAASLLPGIDKNIVLFAFLEKVLPAGLLGLGLVALLAIIMDTINSLILVGSSVMLNDFVGVIRKDITEQNMLKLGRTFTFVYGFMALAVAYFIPDLVRLLLIGGFILMPFAPSLIGALIWKKLSSKAAFTSIIAGLIATVIFIPAMPETAFVPGFLISLGIFVVWSLLSKLISSKQKPIS